MGPINIRNIPQHFKHYFISFIEVSTRYAYVQPLHSRAETAKVINSYLNKIQPSFRRKPEWLISDNAGEYTSKVLTGMVGDMDISHVPTIPYNSEENGITERFNRTIMNAVRAALITAGMKWEYWNWALQVDWTSIINFHTSGQNKARTKHGFKWKNSSLATCSYSDNSGISR